MTGSSNNPELEAMIDEFAKRVRGQSQAYVDEQMAWLKALAEEYEDLGLIGQAAIYRMSQVLAQQPEDEEQHVREQLIQKYCPQPEDAPPEVIDGTYLVEDVRDRQDPEEMLDEAEGDDE